MVVTFDSVRLKAVFAVLVVAASVFLMQYHGIDFWTFHSGKTGILWSFTLEIAAIYLWLHLRILPAVLASTLLIAGPLYQVSSPLLWQTQQAGIDILSDSMVATKSEIEQLENSLVSYEQNSDKRTGWADRIDQTQERLDRARARLYELLQQQALVQQQADEIGEWKRNSVVVMEAVALLVVLYAQIFAISQFRLLRSIRVAKHGCTELERIELVSETAITTVSNPVVTAEILRKHIKNNRLSNREVAMQMGVRPADVSMLLNHAERHETRRETISKPALQKIEKGLRM